MGEVAAQPTERAFYLPSHPLSRELSQKESLRSCKGGVILSTTVKKIINGEQTNFPKKVVGVGALDDPF